VEETLVVRIEPLTPLACEEMVRSRNSKAVSRLKEMGKEVSYLDQLDDMHNHNH
jgi:hypothetical protein